MRIPTTSQKLSSWLQIFHTARKSVWKIGIGDWGLGIGDWGLGRVFQVAHTLKDGIIEKS
ncbi:MAG: hypothetical protein ACSI46_08255 [Gloeotrichia echinulata DVL01]|jgi:hypothetical protein